jgi:hypothetical protein
MATTVQLQPSTKEDLLVIKAQLEQQTGKKSTLDDAIRWLIEKSRSSSLESRISAAEEFFSSIKDLEIDAEDLKKMRAQEISRAAKF